ncbi:MAG: hypothetical protein KJT03_09190, partial [Verrucomicrobiae bacterium]|nr:hypothetical protein [Verrucomicrobiae bacterium]
RRDLETTFTHDAFGRLTSITNPMMETTRMSYCNCGTLEELTDAKGRTTRWQFDLRGRPVEKIFPDDSRMFFSYDSASRLISWTDPRNITRHQAYAADNQLLHVSYTGEANPTPSVHFNYDTYYPRMTQMIDGTGITQFDYKPIGTPDPVGAGLLSAVNGPLARIAYTYDSMGRMATEAVEGVERTMDYDELGRLASSETALGVFGFEYEAGSRLVSKVNFPTGQFMAISRFGSDGDWRVQQISHQRSDASPIAVFEYAYDPEGQITQWNKQRDGGDVRDILLGYDLYDRLTSADWTNPSMEYGYSYDAVGNRTSEILGTQTQNAQFNALNELVSSESTSADSRSFSWDAENRLVAIDRNSGSRSEFSYDGFGRCVKLVEKTGAAVESVKQFVWNRLELVEERDASGQVTRRFFPMGMEIVTGPDSGKYFYTVDHLGSICELMDETGAVRTRYEYDPFGRRVKIEGDLEADFGFTGYYYHAPSGLCMAPFRFYDPDLGRWISRDPLEEADDINLFAYVSNNPLNRIDPLGLSSLGETFGFLKDWVDVWNGGPVPLSIITDQLRGWPEMTDILTKIGQLKTLRSLINSLLKQYHALKNKKCPNFADNLAKDALEKTIKALKNQESKIRKEANTQAKNFDNLYGNHGNAQGLVNGVPKSQGF